MKEECLTKVILFSERSLRRALSDYVEHFHAERNHQGNGNVLLFPRDMHRHCEGPVRCRERLGGLLRSYYHERASSSTLSQPSHSADSIFAQTGYIHRRFSYILMSL